MEIGLLTEVIGQHFISCHPHKETECAGIMSFDQFVKCTFFSNLKSFYQFPIYHGSFCLFRYTIMPEVKSFKKISKYLLENNYPALSKCRVIYRAVHSDV
jgi:hypothetical protein